MMSKNTNQSSRYTHLPAKILLFLPICDNDLSTATILAWCYELEAVAVNNWEQQNREEQRIEDEKRSTMTDDEWEKYQEDKFDIAYERYEDRLLNYYNGESWLNEEEDDIEGFEGRFDIPFADAKRQITKYVNRPTWEFEIEQEAEKIDDQVLLNCVHKLLDKEYLRFNYYFYQLQHDAINAAVQSLLIIPEPSNTEIRRRRELKTVQHHLYVAKRQGLPASLTLDQWLATLEHFHYLCAYCQRSPYEVLEHHIPVIQNGGTTVYNCVPACEACNLRKTDYYPDDVPAEFNMAKGIMRVKTYLQDKREEFIKNQVNKT